MRLSLIVATDEAGLIGRDNALPWRLPADLRHFKAVTMGKPILMGRRTYESIGRPLPGRLNIVVSRSGFQADGVTVVGSLDAALLAAGDADEVMVIGGASLYAQALPQAHRLYLTRIHHRFEGDAWFPALDDAEWNETARDTRAADAANPWACTFLTLERVDG